MRLIYIPKKKPSIKYGLLYNWYAATDANNIANTGWSAPSQIQIETLRDYIGGYLVAGGKLKEVDLLYWDSPNTGATNEQLFNARGCGIRHNLGAFVNINKTMNILSITTISTNYYNLGINHNTAQTANNASPKYYGNCIRLIKDSTTLTHGQTGTYTGNDGKIYRTICIGTQEWLADNLAETKYRNGDTIPEVTDNAAWAALTTGALCAYNNDWSNV